MKPSSPPLSRGDNLARYFNKNYGEILYSGTLAIEAALVALGITQGDYVLIPNDICYRVLLSLIRLGANAIIVNPSNNLVLTSLEIKSVLQKYDVKALILVHNLGLPVNIKEITQNLGSKIPIIEDASQTWKLKYSGFSVGTHSDFVVTSMGATKPLALGIGGGLFSNDDSFKEVLDFNNKSSRENPKSLLPYVLPENLELNLAHAIEIADMKIANAQRIIKLLQTKLKTPQVKLWQPTQGDIPTWHRIPLLINSKEVFEETIKLALQHGIAYQLPHNLALNAIPLALRYNCVLEGKVGHKAHQINLITSQNTVKNISLWLQRVNELKK